MLGVREFVGEAGPVVVPCVRGGTCTGVVFARVPERGCVLPFSDAAIDAAAGACNIPGLASYLVRRSSAVKRGMVGQELLMLAQPLYFVPVPLHHARYRERGYNQAELLAAALATATGGKVCRWLKRKTFVVSQTKLSKDEREMNVAGAFVPNFPQLSLSMTFLRLGRRHRRAWLRSGRTSHCR